jgi:hypothetical protein
MPIYMTTIFYKISSIKNQRLIAIWLMGIFGAVFGHDSVHQLVEFSMSRKRHSCVMRTDL